jgi:hypothetical protein
MRIPSEDELQNNTQIINVLVLEDGNVTEKEAERCFSYTDLSVKYNQRGI